MAAAKAREGVTIMDVTLAGMLKAMGTTQTKTATPSAISNANGAIPVPTAADETG